MTAQPCRCGHTGADPHPCHGRLYTCRKEATERFYDIRAVALAGTQTKFGAAMTWACDACWDAYRRELSTIHTGVVESQHTPRECDASVANSPPVSMVEGELK